MIFQFGRWRVENYVRTPGGEVLLDQASEEKRRDLVRKLYLAAARLIVPAGVEILDVRLVPASIELSVSGTPAREEARSPGASLP